MLKSAIPINPSRRCSHDTCEPRPGTSPNARSSKMPPIDSLRLRRTLISPTISLEAAASRQRTGEASTPAKSARSGWLSGARIDPIWVTCETTDTPSAARKALATAPPATRAAVSRAEARSNTFRTSEKPNFCTPARSACPGRGRWTSGTSASTGHGFIRSSQFLKSRLVTCSATGPPRVRPWRTPAVTCAVSFSIFIRPPRPWPSWRRAMSPSIASWSSSRPAGSPSTIVVRPGPCDSPAVTTCNGTASILRGLNGRRRAPGPAARASAAPAARGLQGGRRSLGALGGTVQRAVLRIEDVAIATLQRDAGLGLERSGRGLGQRLRPGRGVGRLYLGRRLVDLDQVELVLGVGLGARVRDRDELGLAGAQLEVLAVLGGGRARAVALGVDVAGELEDRGLAAILDAPVDQDGVLLVGKDRQPLHALGGELVRLGRAEAHLDRVGRDRLGRRRGRGRGRARRSRRSA